MMETARFSLLALIAVLVPGCGYCSTCDCDSDPQRGDVERDVPVSDLRTALGADGLQPDECDRLCRDVVSYYGTDVDKVYACSVDGSLRPAGNSGAAGAAGAEAEQTLLVHCDMSTTYVCEGRRHANWAHGPRGRGTDAAGAWLARAASAEQGSVHSFLELRKELLDFCAPQELAERALAAAADEVRHARMMRILAHRRGGNPVEIPVEERTQRRSLLDFAIENATEGCVFEAFAALVAAHQAVHSTDRDMRHVMYDIARDEAGHGQLAWDVHVWCVSQLTRDEQRRVRRAMRRAFRRLLVECADLGSEGRIREVLGLPTPAMAVQFARALAHEALSALGQRVAHQAADGHAVGGQGGVWLE